MVHVTAVCWFRVIDLFGCLSIRYPKKRGNRKPALEMGEDGWEGDWEDFALRKHGDNPSAGAFGYVETFDYALPTPAVNRRYSISIWLIPHAGFHTPLVSIERIDRLERIDRSIRSIVSMCTFRVISNHLNI